MAEVFVSFIHENQRVAEAVQSVLSGILNRRVFLSADNWQIFAGEVWLDRIKAELTEAKVVVLMLSALSVSRPWINFEAGAAWLAGKAIVPVCFEGLTKSSMPKPYSGIQGLDLLEDLNYLVRSVSHHLNPKAPTPELVFNHSRAYKTVEAATRGDDYLPHSIDEPWTTSALPD